MILQFPPLSPVYRLGYINLQGPRDLGMIQAVSIDLHLFRHVSELF